MARRKSNQAVVPFKPTVEQPEAAMERLREVDSLEAFITLYRDDTTVQSEDADPIAALVSQLLSRAEADETRRSYGQGVAYYLRWCEGRNVEPDPWKSGTDLPYETLVVQVQQYLATMYEARLTPGTISLRLQALNKAFELMGRPRPGHHPAVKRIMSGIRRAPRQSLKDPNRKDALTGDLLRLVLATLREPTETQLRNAALLQAYSKAVSISSLSRLHWHQVEMAESGVRLMLESASCFLPAEGPGRPVAVWSDLRRAVSATDHEPVFTVRVPPKKPGELGTANSSGDGTSSEDDQGSELVSRRILTRTRIIAILQDRLQGTSANWDGGHPPRLPDDVVDVLVQQELSAGSLALRDSALFIAGWSMAARRSNIAQIRWKHVTDQGAHLNGGTTVRFERTKTDQTGEKHHVRFLPAFDDKTFSPADVLREWRWTYKQLAGVDDLHPDWPVFPALSKSGTMRFDETGKPLALTTVMANNRLQAACERSGLKGNWGMHSLRAGWITSAADAGLDAAAIAEVSEHKSYDVLMGYIRRRKVATLSPTVMVGQSQLAVGGGSATLVVED